MRRIPVFTCMVIASGCTGVFTYPEDATYRTCQTAAECRDTEICFNNYCIYSGCQTTCTPDERLCQSDQAVTCIIDQNGCPVWDVPRQCTSDQVCIDGRCVEKGNCQDECAVGTRSCSNDGGSTLTCEMGADLCLHFVESGTCGPNQTCSGGTCVCDNACQAGSAQCGTNGGEMLCTGPDADGCYTWGQEQPCGPNERCVNGRCTCNNPCQIGNQSCGPNGGEIRCTGPDSDGCYYWGSEQPCIADMECLTSYGQCMPNTPEYCFNVNECRYFGEKLCEDSTHYRTCEVNSNDGCLYWSPG